MSRSDVLFAKVMDVLIQNARGTETDDELFDLYLSKLKGCKCERQCPAYAKQMEQHRDTLRAPGATLMRLQVITNVMAKLLYLGERVGAVGSAVKDVEQQFIMTRDPKCLDLMLAVPMERGVKADGEKMVALLKAAGIPEKFIKAEVVENGQADAIRQEARRRGLPAV